MTRFNKCAMLEEILIVNDINNRMKMREIIQIVESRKSGQTLNEAAVDFDEATCERYEDEFYFQFPVTGGRGFGKIKVHARVDSGHIVNIMNIIASNLSDHPDAFKPKAYTNGVQLGNGMTRKMLRFVVDHLRTIYPDVDQITGERVTGARTGGSITSVKI